MEQRGIDQEFWKLGPYPCFPSGHIIDSSGSFWLPTTYQDQPGKEYLNTNYPVSPSS